MLYITAQLSSQIWLVKVGVDSLLFIYFWTEKLKSKWSRLTDMQSAATIEALESDVPTKKAVAIRPNAYWPFRTFLTDVQL